MSTRSYKMRVSRVANGKIVPVTYSMIPPLSGETTPTGYQIVLLNANDVGRVSETVWLSELKKFLVAIGLPQTEQDKYIAVANFKTDNCHKIGVHISTFTNFSVFKTYTITCSVTLSEPAYQGFTVYGEYIDGNRDKIPMDLVFNAGETTKTFTKPATKYDSVSKPNYTILKNSKYYIMPDGFGGYAETSIVADGAIPHLWMDYDKPVKIEYDNTMVYVTWYLKSNKAALEDPLKINLLHIPVKTLTYDVDGYRRAYVDNAGASYYNDDAFVTDKQVKFSIHYNQASTEAHFTTAHPQKATTFRMCCQILEDDEYRYDRGGTNPQRYYNGADYSFVGGNYYEWLYGHTTLKYIPLREGWYTTPTYPSLMYHRFVNIPPKP